MVQLGTYQQTSTEMAIEIARGLRVILGQRPDIQSCGSSRMLIDLRIFSTKFLSQEVKLSRVKIEAWINADPILILETGHTVCAVHHGGANSFFEAAWYARSYWRLYSHSQVLMKCVTGLVFHNLF
jgi:hypothetical protein